MCTGYINVIIIARKPTVSICILVSSLICCLATHLRAQLYTFSLYESSNTMRSLLVLSEWVERIFNPHSSLSVSSWQEMVRNFTKSAALSSGGVRSVREGSVWCVSV